MDWDIETFRNELEACDFFQKRRFVFSGHKVRNANFEAHEFQLENKEADRSIEITFAPMLDELPPVSQVYLIRPSTGKKFSLNDYIKQYHGLDLGPEGFRYNSYSGTFAERVRAFLKFATTLLSEYAEPVLSGKDFPPVEFDWHGYK